MLGGNHHGNLSNPEKMTPATHLAGNAFKLVQTTSQLDLYLYSGSMMKTVPALEKGNWNLLVSIMDRQLQLIISQS